MPILPGNVLQRRHLAEGDISGELKIKQEGNASSLDGLTLDSAVEQLFQDRVAGDTALQTELDATQAGAGLYADGSVYLGNRHDLDSNGDVEQAAFLGDWLGQGSVTSLAHGITRLDKTLASYVSVFQETDTALQTELDATQTGAGLGSAGTYSAPPSTNYLHLDGSLYLSGSTDIRDAAIKAAAAAARTSYRAGFSVDGSDTYDPNASWIGNKPDVDAGDRHYIGDAVALSHADAVLDTTVKAHKDALDNVQTELDDTQATLGLHPADGSLSLAYDHSSYDAPATNYFGEWDGNPAIQTMAQGLTRLDAVVSVNASNVSVNTSNVSDLQTELDDTQMTLGLHPADGSLSLAYDHSSYDAPATNYFGEWDGNPAIQTMAQGLTRLDAVVASNVSNLQTELDDTQASLGLGTDGSLSLTTNTNNGDGDATNYFGSYAGEPACDTVVDGLTRLDVVAAVNELNIGMNTLNVSNLQTELDDTQASLGLGTDGSLSLAYNTNSPDMDVTNYFGIWESEPACDTVVDALTRLDAVVSVNTFNVAGNANDIAAESARIDAILDAAGANPDSFADVVELINSVDTENDNALATVIGNLNSEIATTNGEVTTLQAADTAATADRAAIRTDFAAADSNLQSNLVTIQQGAGLDGAVGYMQNASMTYIGAAVSLADADEKLDVALAAEASTRGAADTTLQNNIDTEKNRIDAANTRLGSSVGDGFSVAKNGDFYDFGFGNGHPRMRMQEDPNAPGQVLVCFDIPTP